MFEAPIDLKMGTVRAVTLKVFESLRSTMIEVDDCVLRQQVRAYRLMFA